MFLPPLDPGVTGGGGREASGWLSLFQIVLVLGSRPKRLAIQYAHWAEGCGVGVQVRGTSASCQ